MIFEIDKIKEVKVVSVDVDAEYAYLDKLKDGSWRLVYTKNLEKDFVLRERE